MGLNVINLVGRAGADPQVRYFDSGKVLCELSLAVGRRSSKTDPPDWFKLKIWNKTAEIAANFVRKGGLIGIQGELVIETWTDRNTGANRSSPVIVVDKLELLGSKRDNDSGSINSYQEADEF
ncbi:MAG: single-stranded DNA-binding protein [cyanobacterium endosymbiont of Epithemia adnata isolate EadnSB Bon19]|jgi:single-strand DNA-binding protein|uniref:single-stranded DNA-binding protein n=1 Tax=cyanobacterium endosymbiont of Epithemia turgida TaxID=718217 RepID=UPI0004D1CB97|nr:single-stranded DNA-binding protein [cyanobacterium endosymbiont of Epithemia turgida]BAP18007.1 single-stranded DNA-binding protein [cyanobacterium endosymbiont of Epithemia turgida isolate EtSB Lake Yunoko]